MITTSVAEAAKCLEQGQVLAYPTEAVWGLGCDPFNESAFLEILRLKQRPIEKGVILLAGQISQIEHLLQPLDATTRQQVTVLQHGYSQQMTVFRIGLKAITPKWPFV